MSGTELHKARTFDVKQNTNKSGRRNYNYETCHKNALDEKIVLLESNSSFLQELHKKQIIIEKLLDNMPSNNDKVKTVKHLSENQKQKIQHQEKQQDYVISTFRIFASFMYHKSRF